MRRARPAQAYAELSADERKRNLLEVAKTTLVKAWHENLNAAPGSWSLARTAEKLHVAGICHVLPATFQNRMKATNEDHVINRRAGMGQVSSWEKALFHLEDWTCACHTARYSCLPRHAEPVLYRDTTTERKWSKVSITTSVLVSSSACWRRPSDSYARLVQENPPTARNH